MVEVHTKSATRRRSQIQMRTRRLSGLVAIFTRYTKEREAYEDNVDCTRTATGDGNKHGSECQYCEQSNMEVSLEEKVKHH